MIILEKFQGVIYILLAKLKKIKPGKTDEKLDHGPEYRLLPDDGINFSE
jgi:hypothetical protein